MDKAIGDTQTFLQKLSDASVKHRMEHPRNVTWVSSLTTAEVLDALRRNHEAMNRNDSIYWQAEITILKLLDTIDMIAACANACGHSNDAAIEEIKRLAEQASK